MVWQVVSVTQQMLNRIVNFYYICTMHFFPIISYRKAIQAIKDRSSKAAPQYGSKTRQYMNPRQVECIECIETNKSLFYFALYRRRVFGCL